MWREGTVPGLPGPTVLPWAAPSEAVQLYSLGIDPGGGSGWAVLRIELARLQAVGLRALALEGGIAALSGEVRGPEPFQAELLLSLVRAVWAEGWWEAGGDRCVLGVERFVLRMLSMDDDLLSPVRITAMLEALSWRGLPFPVIFHGTSDLKSIVTDDRLRRLGLWHSSLHARDALRVAVLTARKFCAEPEWVARVEGRMAWLGKGVEVVAL